MVDGNKPLYEDDDLDENEELEENQDLEDDNDDDDRLESEQRDAQEKAEDGSEESARQLKRKRQKQRQKENMRKTREENQILLRELEEAKARLAALETRNINSDAQTAEQHYNQALQNVQIAESALKEAFETGDGEKAIRAQRLREQSITAAREAEELKRRLQDPSLRQQTKVLDSRTESHAQRWMEDNPWFSPTGKDEDSVIARAIDEAWAEEARKRGISPSSETYWDELDVRVKRRLGDSVDRKQRRSTPPVSGRGERTSHSTREPDIVSPARREALMKANLWDDPVLRKKYLESFKKYDRENRT